MSTNKAYKAITTHCKSQLHFLLVKIPAGARPISEQANIDQKTRRNALHPHQTRQEQTVTKMSASSFALGQKAQIITNKSVGIVRYSGSLHFIEGDWLGLELPDDSGKNDGEVQGKRYFTCQPNHGVFVKTANAKAIVEPSPMAAPLKKVSKRPSLAVATGTASSQKPNRLSMVAPAARQTTLMGNRKSVTSSILKVSKSMKFSSTG